MRYLLPILCLAVLHITAFAKNQQVNQVNSIEFNRLIAEEKGTLLDVRTNFEFKNGYIEGSGNLNYYSLSFQRKLLLLPRNEPIYLYCNTGYRSQKAGEILVANGYTRVFNLEHGIMEWEQMNLPVEVAPDARPDTQDMYSVEQYNDLFTSGKPVLIDFYAPWCGPCRAMMPMIDSLKVEHFPDIEVVKINVDASKRLVKELKIGSVPYLTLHHKGRIIYVNKGVATRNELENQLSIARRMANRKP